MKFSCVFFISLLLIVTSTSNVTAQTQAETMRAQTFLEEGNRAMTRGDFQTAIAHYSKAKDLAPNSVVIYSNRGAAYSNSGDYDSAIRDFDVALELSRKLTKVDLAMLYYNRGSAFQGKGDYEKSIEDLTKSIELNPSSANSYINRGNTFLLQKKYDLARADLERSIELSPQPSAYYNLAKINTALKNFDDAIVNLSKAIDLNPRFSEALSNRGAVYQKKGDLEAALKDFSTAISIKQAGIYFANRATVYLRQRKFTEAVNDLTKASESYPRWRVLYLQRSLAYRRLNLISLSDADLLKAKEVEKENFEPFKGASFLYLYDLQELEKQIQ